MAKNLIIPQFAVFTILNILSRVFIHGDLERFIEQDHFFQIKEPLKTFFCQFSIYRKIFDFWQKLSSFGKNFRLLAEFLIFRKIFDV